MRWIFAALAIASTGPKSSAVVFGDPARECKTSCGLVLVGSDDCSAIQQYEDAVLASYAKHVKGWTVEKECGGLRDYRIYVLDADPRGRFHTGEEIYYGVTYKIPVFHVDGGVDPAPGGLIFLGTDNWEQSALAHEIGHVLDDVYSVPNSGDHPKWTSRGLCAAIREVSKLAEWCFFYD